MASAHSLQGLIKWLARDEWRDRFAGVYDAHLQPTCESLGVDVDQVVSILGKGWFMTTVWGSAFEDFLTRDFDDGRNIVDDYLKRRGWKESASTRAYMTALRRSVASLYEVSDVVKDTSFWARDLVRGGDPILIIERSATRSLKQWDRIAARVVQVGSQAQVGGALLQYQREPSEDILRLLRNVAKRADKEKQKFTSKFGSDVNHPAIVDGFSQTAILRAAAPKITTFWLIDIINRSINPPVLDVRNIEGDDLLFCAVHFPLAADATADDIRMTLNRCPVLRQETTTFWNWFGTRNPIKTLGRKKGTSRQLALATTLDDGSLVLGGLELKDRTLVLSVNSQARSSRGRALFSQLLGDLVREPLVEMQTLDQTMSARPNSPTPPELSLTEEERRTIIHQSLDRHYRDMLDQPAPFLGNKSPRAAVRTAKGRAGVIDWLKMLENHAANSAGQNEAMATYDFTWLWEELGLIGLRR
ncbi:MAG: hypothetical protein ABSB77_14860 [Xanthobacteraceae bacterium]|jgi:hypothetical protein